MKQEIRLSENDLQKLIKESVSNFLKESESVMNYGPLADEYYANKDANKERFVDCGEDFGVWRISGSYVAPTDDKHIWCFGAISFPRNYINAPDEKIIRYIKDWCIDSLQRAYRNM